MLNKQVDYKLFFVVFALMIFWMIMISSVSVYPSYKVTAKLVNLWLAKETYNYFYVIRNVLHVIMACITLIFFVKIPYVFFEKNANKIYILNLILLVFVLIFWSTFWGSRRWLLLPWGFSIQPWEFLIFSVIVFFSAYFKRNANKLSDLKEGYFPFLWLIWVTCLLLALQPKFWAILIVWTVAFSLFIISWAKIKHIFITILIWLFSAFWIYNIWKYDINNPKETRNSLSYITERVDTFLANKKDLISSKKMNYQLEQGFIAIGSWGFKWLWFWNSIQKFGYLPEAQWDFIFPVLIEELWFIWGILILSIYWFIWYRWYYISFYSTDIFAKLASFWVATWILVQAFINIWVTLWIIPLTWITLPFLSYGWSSILALTMWVGLLLNISRYIEPSKKGKRVRTFATSHLNLNLYD